MHALQLGCKHGPLLVKIFDLELRRLGFGIESRDALFELVPLGPLTFVSKFSVDWGQMKAAEVLALIPAWPALLVVLTIDTLPN